MTTTLQSPVHLAGGDAGAPSSNTPERDSAFARRLIEQFCEGDGRPSSSENVAGFPGAYGRISDSTDDPDFGMGLPPTEAPAATAQEISQKATKATKVLF